MQEPQKEQDFHEFKDLRVLSVPVGKTYALVTEHNVYSCPVSHPEHDETVDAFAPRNEEGRIPKIHKIAARIVTDPNNPDFSSYFNTEYAQNIKAYISVVKSIAGILDGGGKYRFYVLEDVEKGTLKHAPRLSRPGPAHVYISLKELLSGSKFVNPL